MLKRLRLLRFRTPDELLKTPETPQELFRKSAMKKLHWKYWPLAVQFALAMMFMIVLAVAGTMLFVIYNEQQTFRTELQQQALLLLDTLEASLIDHLYNEDADALQDVVEVVGNDHQSVSSCRIYGPEGIILADAQDETLSYLMEIDPVGQQLLQSQTIMYDWQIDVLLAGRSIFIEGLPLGAISVGLSIRSLQHKLNTLRNQALGIACATIIIGTILSLLISRSITKPLKRLVLATEQIAEGNLSQALSLYSSHKDTPNDLSITQEQQGKNEIRKLFHSFYVMSTYLQDMAVVAENISRGEIEQTFSPRSTHDVLGNAFQKMTFYLGEMAEIAEILSLGVLSQNIRPKNQRDVLGTAFSQMISYIRNVANIAEHISEGDLHVEVASQSDQDVLNQSLQKMIRYIQNIEAIVKHIAQNNLDIEVIPQSEQDHLNISLQHMVNHLRVTQSKIEHSIAEIEQQNWMKTGQAELSNVMRGKQKAEVLAKHIITYLASYLQAQVGAIYLVHASNGIPYLKLTASYAYTRRDAHRDIFRFGEGLVGQAALEQECQIYFNLSKDTILIGTETGEIIPNTVLLAPFLNEQTVKGVIELGTTGTFEKTHLTFLQEVMGTIAMAF